MYKRQIDNRANNVINEFGKLISRILSVVTISAILFTIEPILIPVSYTHLVEPTVTSPTSVLKDIKKFDVSIWCMNPTIRKNDYIVRVFYLRDYAKAVSYTHLDVYKRQYIHYTDHLLCIEACVTITLIAGCSTSAACLLYTSRCV